MAARRRSIDPVKAREMAEAGASVAEAARALNVAVPTIYAFSYRSGIKFTRPSILKTGRTQKIVDMFRQGVSMEKIGKQFNLTRERVRQVLKHAGLCKQDGGATKRGAANRQARSAKREATSILKHGLPADLMRELRRDGVTAAFQRQRQNAIDRAIEWRLSFAEWHAIWTTSGKLAMRGRGKGRYVMSRIRDDGGYEIGNVHIQLAVENSREAVDKWRGKTKENRGVFFLYPGMRRPYVATANGKRIGSFETEAEAVEARRAHFLAAGVQGPIAPKARAHPTPQPEKVA